MFTIFSIGSKSESFESDNNQHSFSQLTGKQNSINEKFRGLELGDTLKKISKNLKKRLVIVGNGKIYFLDDKDAIPENLGEKFKVYVDFNLELLRFKYKSEDKFNNKEIKSLITLFSIEDKAINQVFAKNYQKAKEEAEKENYYFLDFDGALCIANKVKGLMNGPSLLKNYAMSAEDIFNHNSLLFENIKYLEGKLGIGSNRQNEYMELNNSFKNVGFYYFSPCWLSLEKICKQEKISFNKRLLPDILNEKNDNKTFDKIKSEELKKIWEKVDKTELKDEDYKKIYNEINKIKNNENNKEWQQYITAEKFWIILAHAHDVAKISSKQKAIHFLDDRIEILKSLKSIFTAFPELLPSNVALSLTHYAGEIKVNNFKPVVIKGSGEVKDMKSLIELIKKNNKNFDPEVFEKEIKAVADKKIQILMLLNKLIEKKKDNSTIKETLKRVKEQFEENPSIDLKKKLEETSTGYFSSAWKELLNNEKKVIEAFRKEYTEIEAIFTNENKKNERKIENKENETINNENIEKKEGEDKFTPTLN